MRNYLNKEAEWEKHKAVYRKPVEIVRDFAAIQHPESRSAVGSNQHPADDLWPRVINVE